MADQPNRFCPNCGASLQADAQFCHACGKPAQKQETAPSPPQARWPKKEASKKAQLVILMILLGFLAIGIITVANNPPTTNSGRQTPTQATATQTPDITPTTATSTPEGPPISWQEVDAIYNLSSKNTDLQKDEEWKRFKGKRVTWSGRVSAVQEGLLGGLTLQVKMNRDTLTSDLLITLKESEKAKALQLHEGDRVRFTGILSDWGSLVPITLDDGEITE